MIWDLNIRIFHLLLILTITISIISGKYSYFYIHEISGVTLFFLILFRIYWGFFGGYYSKFKNFNLNKNSLLNYFKNNKIFFGHNPLGSLSIFSIFISSNFFIFKFLVYTFSRLSRNLLTNNYSH